MAGKRIVINLEDQKARDSLQRREFKKLANRFVKDIPPHASKAFEQFVPKLPSAAIGDMLRPIDVKWREQLRTSIENIQRHYLASSRGPVHFNPPNPMLEVLHRIDARMDRIGACLPSQSQPDEKPAEEVAPVRSGAQGRPSSMHLVLIELERRAAAGELKSSAAAESRSLAVWLKATYPKAAPAGPNAIRNGIAETHRIAKARIRTAPNADSTQRSDAV